jgi:hypothetical protein
MVIRLSYGWLATFVLAFSFMPEASSFLPSSPRRSFAPTSMPFNSLTPSSDLRTHEASSYSTSLGMWSQDDELRGSDRIKACVPYILPLIDGDQFGRYIYLRCPPLAAVNDFVLGPLLTISHKVPFFGVGLFCALTLGTRFNTDMSRNVRFSAQQAALIDVALIIPELFAESTGEDPIPRYLAEPCNNFVYYAYMSAVIYSVYNNLKGKRPDQLPYISNFADQMVGPF